jgi:hypothetical protein
MLAIDLLGASKMARQLNIRSDEACQLARDIAKRRGVTTAEAVLQALRDYGSKMAPSLDGLTPTQRAEFEALMKLARKAAKHKKPGMTSGHSDMYDEYGLPI